MGKKVEKSIKFKKPYWRERGQKVFMLCVCVAGLWFHKHTASPLSYKIWSCGAFSQEFASEKEFFTGHSTSDCCWWTKELWFSLQQNNDSFEGPSPSSPRWFCAIQYCVSTSHVGDHPLHTHTNTWRHTRRHTHAYSRNQKCTYSTLQK